MREKKFPFLFFVRLIFFISWFWFDLRFFCAQNFPVKKINWLEIVLITSFTKLMSSHVTNLCDLIICDLDSFIFLISLAFH